MIKKIKFRDKVILYDTVSQDGFEDVLDHFDRKITTMVSFWTRHIPDHDIDDLSQICKMKLVDGLEAYDDKANINFTTFIYTLWKRKLSQLSYKYKTKKYSRKIDNDNYISFNYSFDRQTDSFYLILNKHKCPLNRKIVDKNTCRNCEHHNGYKQKEISKGKDKGVTKDATLCGYFKRVLEQRGTSLISLDKKIAMSSGDEVSMANIIPNQEDEFRDIHFKMDLENMKEKMSSRKGKRSARLDKTSFIILQLLVEGLSKADIIKKMNMEPNQFNKRIRKLGRNKDLMNLVR